MPSFIPQGYNQVMPYLIVNGALKLKAFMQTVFDAVENEMYMRDEHTVMHGQVKIGDSLIMFADSTEQFAAMTGGLFIYVANADETYHKAIAAGGTSVMDLSDQDYGRTCGVKDPAGNTWWITAVPIKEGMKN